MGIKIAVSKGRLGDDFIKKLNGTVLGEAIDQSSRKLIFHDESSDVSVIFFKNSDVLAYVENGIADMGIVGSDMIHEQNADVYCLQKLDIGVCKLCVAGFPGANFYERDMALRVATKFPNLAKEYFDPLDQAIKIIKLNGSIELAPVLGLSDVIVDIVETGSTLKANGLEVLEEIGEVSGYVIANKVSYKFNRKKIDAIIQALVQKEEHNDSSY